MTRFAGLFIIAVAPTMLRGQGASDSTHKDSTSQAQRLAPVVVSASREPMSQALLGVSASVITSAALQSEPALSAADIVSRLPGVYMDYNAGPGGPANIRLRGAEEAFTKVLMDGVEVNVSGGPFRFQGITANNLDRVELVRGPQSALHGSNAMAGVVQFLTKEGRPGVARWAMETEGGAGAVHGGHLDANVAVDGGTESLRYSLGVGAGSADGIYDVSNRLRTEELSTRIDAFPIHNVSLTGTVRVRNPGATRVPLDPNQRDQNEMLVSGLTATITPSPAWQHQFRVGVYHDLFAYTDQLDSVVAHPSIPYFNGDAYTRTDLLRTTVNYDATRRFIGTGGKQASITVGGALEREATGDTVGGDFGNGFTPERRNHASLLSELSATVGPTSFLAGSRFEWYTGLGWVAVPRASVHVTAMPGRLALRAAIGRGFMAPNIEQQFTSNAFIVPNPDLKPETSWSSEAGADVTVSSSLTVSATYFQQRFDGIIEVVAAPPPETRFISENLGRTDANGLELEAAGALPHGVRASGNLSWIHTAIKNNAGLDPAAFPVDSALPERPAIVAGGTVEVPLGRRWRALARTTVIGRQVVLSEIFSGKRQTLDPYALFGVTLTYDVTPQWALYGRGDNLANANNPAGFDRRGIPRMWTVGLRVAQ